MSDKFVKKIEENPFVYHYTSIEALFAILEGYRQKKCFGLPFRAHCIYNVNDKREMELGYETVKKILPQYEASQPNSKHLSDVYQKAEYEKKCIEQFSEKPSDGQINMGNVPYTISFSCKRDFLPMWSMYGNDKKGACLKINLYRLIDTNHSQKCFVYYDGDEDNLIEAYFLPLLYEFFISSQNNPMSIEDKIKELSMLCECLSPFIKSRDWAYEQEFRFVYNKHYSPIPLDINEIHEESIREFLIHGYEKKKVEDYIYLPIPPDALKEIIIGPLANYQVVEHILNNELKECLINNVEITPSSICVRR